MALIVCKECGAQVSTKAASCPSCGAARPKPTSAVTKLVAGLLIFGVVMAVIGSIVGPDRSGSSATAAADPPKKVLSPAEQKRNAQQTMAAVGAQALKKASKDPDSFEMKEVNLMPDGAACYTYRARNSFNAMLQGEAIMTDKGKLLVHEQNGNTFVSAWNRSCTKDGGEDLLPLLKQAEII